MSLSIGVTAQFLGSKLQNCKTYGGHSIGVYNADTQDKKKVYKMMHDKRIKYFAPADYSDGRELDTLVKAIIDRTAYNEKLETMHYKNLNEAAEAASEKK